MRSGDPIAVIDIGSNSGRVMVFERDTAGHLRLLAGSRAPLRLVHDVDEDAELSEATKARTMESLRDFSAKALSAAGHIGVRSSIIHQVILSKASGSLTS